MQRTILSRLPRTLSLRTAPSHLRHKGFISSSVPLLRTQPIDYSKSTPLSSPRYFSSHPPQQARYNRFGDSGGQFGGGGQGFQSSPNTASTVVIGMSILAGTYYVAQCVPFFVQMLTMQLTNLYQSRARSRDRSMEVYGY